MRAIRLAAIPAAVFALLVAAAPASAEPTLMTQAINTFQNQQSGRRLDDSFAYGVRTYPCNGLDFQKWSVRTRSDVFGVD